VLRMAEPELPTSSDSTSASSTSTSTSTAGNEAGPSQIATGSGGVATAAEGTGDGGVAGTGTSQQGGEDMSVQVDAAGSGNDQSEDMVIEAGPSHIGKRVKVCLDHPRKIRREC